MAGSGTRRWLGAVAGLACACTLAVAAGPIAPAGAAGSRGRGVVRVEHHRLVPDAAGLDGRRDSGSVAEDRQTRPVRVAERPAGPTIASDSSRATPVTVLVAVLVLLGVVLSGLRTVAAANRARGDG